MRLRAKIGCCLIVATAVTIAAYGYVDAGIVDRAQRFFQRDATPASTVPGNRSARIDSDMRDTFRKLETMPVAGPTPPKPRPMAVTTSAPGDQRERTSSSPAATRATTVEQGDLATSTGSPAAARTSAAPARAGMPTSLLPGAYARSAAPTTADAAPSARAMDPRTTAALNRVTSQSAPRPELRPSIAATTDAPPAALPSTTRPAPALVDEANMTADQLNERELQRARTGAVATE